MKKMLLIVSLFAFSAQGLEASQYNPSGSGQSGYDGGSNPRQGQSVKSGYNGGSGKNENQQKLIEPKILTMGEGQGHVSKLSNGSISVLLPSQKQQKTSNFFSLENKTVNKVPALSEFFQTHKRSMGTNNVMVAALNLAALQIDCFEDNKFAAVMNTVIMLKASGKQQELDALMGNLKLDQRQVLGAIKIGQTTLGEIVKPTLQHQSSMLHMMSRFSRMLSMFNYENFKGQLNAAKTFKKNNIDKYVGIAGGVTIGGLIVFLLMYNRSAA